MFSGVICLTFDEVRSYVANLTEIVLGVVSEDGRNWLIKNEIVKTLEGHATEEG